MSDLILWLLRAIEIGGAVIGIAIGAFLLCVGIVILIYKIGLDETERKL